LAAQISTGASYTLVVSEFSEKETVATLGEKSKSTGMNVKMTVSAVHGKE